MLDQFTPRDVTRFWSKVDCSGGPDSCWLWIGGRTESGYGRFSVKRHLIFSHRFSWRLHHGSIPDGLHVCHNCPNGDNPSCVNPKHLWLGTPADNMADMVAKGRQAVGDKNGMRLYPERVLRGDDHWTRRLPELVLRGDENGSHLHPECRPYGEKNGANTHPEKRPRGEGNGQSKLTNAKVEVIRAAYATGQCTVRSLAAEFRVSKSLVSVIVRNEYWKTDDEPRCDVPTHLLLSSEDRGRTGERNGRSKLTTEQVAAIRLDYASGRHTQRSLAGKYGVSRGSIGPILRGTEWRP